MSVYLQQMTECWKSCMQHCLTPHCMTNTAQLMSDVRLRGSSHCSPATTERRHNESRAASGYRGTPNGVHFSAFFLLSTLNVCVAMRQACGEEACAKYVGFGEANTSSLPELLASFFVLYHTAVRRWSLERTTGLRCTPCCPSHHVPHTSS